MNGEQKFLAAAFGRYPFFIFYATATYNAMLFLNTARNKTTNMLFWFSKATKKTLCYFIYNAINDPHRYAVQESDTTMMPRAASLFGQHNLLRNIFSIPAWMT